MRVLAVCLLLGAVCLTQGLERKKRWAGVEALGNFWSGRLDTMRQQFEITRDEMQAEVEQMQGELADVRQQMRDRHSEIHNQVKSQVEDGVDQMSQRAEELRTTIDDLVDDAQDSMNELEEQARSVNIHSAFQQWKCRVIGCDATTTTEPPQ